MHLLRSFRLSTYLTLAIACIALGYSEGGLLPETPFITGFVVVLLAIAFRLEGRWALSLQAANILGAILFLGLVAWLFFRLTNKPAGLAFLPFPTSLFPFLGPVLLILIPAKLFRPKHVGDFWTMQGIGLLAVALGCALAIDFVFRLLLVVYFGFFLWSMSLFHLYREIRPDRSEQPKQPQKGSFRFYSFRRAVRWTVGLVPASLLLFAITPRPNDKKWELPLVVRGKMETGLPEGKVDLNQTGTLTPNRELAFEVQAEDAEGNPKLDINLDQRWRSWALTRYENGVWELDRHSGLLVLDRTNNRAIPTKTAVNRNDPFSEIVARLPDFGPQRYFLTFSLHLPKSAAERFREIQILSDPVLWRPNDAPPILVFGIRAGAVQHRTDGAFEWFSVPTNNRPNYCQVTAPLWDADLGPPMSVTNSYQDFLTRIPQRPMAERLRQWSTTLLERLIEEGKLASAALSDLDPYTRMPLPKHHEAIARALEFHLSQSGEFTYSLKTSLKDRKADPVEDFLFGTKSGKCDQYASALALMLRSLGIPAQLVVGFRGCESRGDGWYEVRQSNAHAWVEVLVSRTPPSEVVTPLPNARPFRNNVSYHWLSLDPTPAGDPSVDNDSGSIDWLERSYTKGEAAFRKILRSTAFEMELSLDELQEGTISWWTAAVAGAMLLVSIGFPLHRYRRRHRETRKEERPREFDAELLSLLGRHGWKMQAGETPLEFTTRVANGLANHPEVAEIPLLFARTHYRVRFGGEKLSEFEVRKLRDALGELKVGLSAISGQQSAVSSQQPAKSN